MEQAITIGLDIAQYVFQVHGADGAGRVLFRKRITRVKLLSLGWANCLCGDCCGSARGRGFPAGRDFAAWLGLTPLQKSTGGKQKLGAVSKRNERTIRRLLIIGRVPWFNRPAGARHPRARG